MKQFLKLTLSFILLLALFLFGILELMELELNRRASFKLAKSPKQIILGHSHPECAFNDSLIRDTKNLSQSGESYFFTYFKTKKLLEQNPSIQTVFLEFTNNQVRESMNRWIWEDSYMNHRYPKYAPFMQLEDKYLLAKNNFSGFINTNSLALKNNLGRIAKSKYSYTSGIGSYLPLDKHNADSLVLVMQSKPRKTDSDSLAVNPISESNIKYLQKIISLCQNHGKRVILIRSPQHPLYGGFNNEKTYQEIRNSLFPDLEYLDFSQFPLTNSQYADLEHLNYKGAKKFSDWFQQLLEKGILDSPKKQHQIDEEINLLEN